MKQKTAVWFPTVRCDTGTDIFTETLVRKLREGYAGGNHLATLAG
jgi:hypothetical protein